MPGTLDLLYVVIAIAILVMFVSIYFFVGKIKNASMASRNFLAALAKENGLTKTVICSCGTKSEILSDYVATFHCPKCDKKLS